MSGSIISKVDGKGRLLIPASFREVLNIRENSNVLLTINTEKKVITLLPFAAAGEKLYSVRLNLSDAPGSLAQVLGVLSSFGVDLVQSESIASDRGRQASWKGIVDLRYCKKGVGEIKRKLGKEKVASEILFEKI